MTWTEGQKLWRQERVAKHRAIMHEAKSQPCADCGVSYPPYIMDFDHVRGEKKFTVGVMLTAATQTLLDEIAKCEVVCANCHRVRTHERKQWGRPVLPNSSGTAAEA